MGQSLSRGRERVRSPRTHHEGQRREEDAPVVGSKRPRAGVPANGAAGVTVIVADLSGLSSWASTMSRYPAAESHSFFFQTFESTAKEHDVCTVEMTQDRYVAIIGNAIQDEFHTLKMSRFVRDVRRYVIEYVHMCTKAAATIDELTALVNMRIGMAVGQVASSIVREEDSSRWHLSGETVNMAEQMATTSNQGRCQLTPQAARSLLAQACQWQSSTRWSWSLHVWLRSRFRIRGKVQRLEDMEPVLVDYEDTYKLLQGMESMRLSTREDAVKVEGHQGLMETMWL